MRCLNCGAGSTCFNCRKDDGNVADTLTTLRAENERLRELVGEAVKYIVEDKAVTPRATRLERWVDLARAALKGGG